jgi:hypothetical protein
MAWLLVMDIENSPYEKGDVVIVRDEHVGAKDVFGKRPLDNIYHRVIHVADMSLAKAEMYLGMQPDYDPRDPLHNPNAKRRAWKIDFDLFPAAKKAKIQAPKVPFSARYEMTTNRYKLGAEDANVTDAEFSVAASMKPTIPR